MAAVLHGRDIDFGIRSEIFRFVVRLNLTRACARWTAHSDRVFRSTISSARADTVARNGPLARPKRNWLWPPKERNRAVRHRPRTGRHATLRRRNPAYVKSWVVPNGV